ncbi:MAG TPA: helix-turn-helix domain-containing protein [Yinghuangia sp.]|nr:helix-turn-helix domain-containing protein [Yinghuangia sp.]
MHVQLTRGERGYSTLHDILQDDRLSLVARGLLGYLLTVPDAAHLNVRTLADKHLGLGRRGVSKALDELIEAGYYQRRTFRDDKTGHVRTVTYVFDAPQGTATPIPEPPVPAPPGIGDAALGETGELPVGELREEQQRENPTLPPQGAENARKLSAGNISLPRCRREGGASPAGAEDDQPQPSAEPEEPDDPDGPDASQVPRDPGRPRRTW